MKQAELETRTYPCGVSATGTAPLPLMCPEHSTELDCVKALVKEASEIMQIVYAGNFPAGIDSFLVRAAAAVDSRSLVVPPAPAQADKICETCHGRRWIMRTESHDHGNGIGSGGAWNEPCPDCSVSLRPDQEKQP